MEANYGRTGAGAASVAGQQASLKMAPRKNYNNIQNSRAGVGWGFTVGGIASGHARTTAGAQIDSPGSPLENESPEEPRFRFGQKSKSKS